MESPGKEVEHHGDRKNRAWERGLESPLYLQESTKDG